MAGVGGGHRPGGHGGRRGHRGGRRRPVRQAGQPVHLGPVHGLALQQQVGQRVEDGPVLGEQLDRPLLGLAQQHGDLAVDLRLGRLGERAAGHAGSAAAEEHRAALRVPDRSERLGQAELPDHLGGQVGRPGQVVGRAGGALAEHHQLGGPAAEPDRERVVQVVLAVQVPFDQRQLLGHAERLARRAGSSPWPPGRRARTARPPGRARTRAPPPRASPPAAARWSLPGGPAGSGPWPRRSRRR